MRNRPLVIFSVLLVSGVLGCGGSGGGGVLGQVTSFVIDAIGGIFKFRSESVKIEIPRDAVDGVVKASIASAIGIPVTPLLVLGSAYELLAEVTKLKKVAKLEIKYDPRYVPGGATESDLRLFKKTGDTWVEVEGSTVNPEKDRVEGQFDTFGTYGVMVSNSAVESRLQASR
jgi:hypothetical protein